MTLNAIHNAKWSDAVTWLLAVFVSRSRELTPALGQRRPQQRLREPSESRHFAFLRDAQTGSTLYRISHVGVRQRRRGAKRRDWELQRDSFCFFQSHLYCKKGFTIQMWLTEIYICNNERTHRIQTSRNKALPGETYKSSKRERGPYVYSFNCLSVVVVGLLVNLKVCESCTLYLFIIKYIHSSQQTKSHCWCIILITLPCSQYWSQGI